MRLIDKDQFNINTNKLHNHAQLKNNLHSYHLVDNFGNVPRTGSKQKFPDLEVIALIMNSLI